MSLSNYWLRIKNSYKQQSKPAVRNSVIKMVISGRKIAPNANPEPSYLSVLKVITSFELNAIIMAIRLKAILNKINLNMANTKEIAASQCILFFMFIFMLLFGRMITYCLNFYWRCNKSASVLFKIKML